MKRLILAAVVLLAGCSTTSAPKDVTSNYGIGATGAGERPVTVSGSGMVTTATFALLGSEYRVDWTARDTGGTNVGCYHATDLYDGAGKHVGDLGSGSVDGGETKSGTTYLHNLQRGDHYVDASSGCEWTVTFTAQ